MKYRILGIIGLLIALNGIVGVLMLWLVYGANIAEWLGPFASNFAQMGGGAVLAWWGLTRWHGPRVKAQSPVAGDDGPPGGAHAGDAAVTGSEQGKPKLGIVALIFAIIGILIMVFSGGCALMVIVDELTNHGSDFRIGIEGALIFGGLPFAVGLIIWLLAMASRKPRQRE